MLNTPPPDEKCMYCDRPLDLTATPFRGGGWYHLYCLPSIKNGVVDTFRTDHTITRAQFGPVDWSPTDEWKNATVIAVGLSYPQAVHISAHLTLYWERTAKNPREAWAALLG